MFYHRFIVFSALFFVLGCSGHSKKTVLVPEYDIKGEIQTTLKEHPEIVLDTLRENSLALLEIVNEGARAKGKQQRMKAFRDQLANPRNPEIQEGRCVLGKADAPIIVVGYSDFQCYYCVRAAETIQELIDKYPEKVRFYFKHLPANDLALKEALYFEAIAKQDSTKAWVFHDLVFGKQGEVAEKRDDALRRIIVSLDIDMVRVEKDLKSEELSALIAKDKEEAKKFGFRGTPIFLVNGVSLLGAAPLKEFEDVIKLIEEKG